MGLHRTINISTLQSKLKTGAAESILFPTNVIQNISSIISNLQSIFPAKKDQFIIGPMAKITWGTPSIISLQVGLMIEFANPVTISILGLIKSVLPKESKPIIQFKVAFLGVINFAKKQISFDASIYDSKILTFALSGDMALRLSWGTKKDFLLTVGGFHPAYKVPSYLSLPAIRRLTINFLTGNPSLTLASYFAITSNTLQFGSKIDFNYTVSKASATGQFSFDVLIQFSPFYFSTNMSGLIAIKWKEKEKMSVTLLLSVTGPTPWRLNGKLTFNILGFKYEKSIDKSFGSAYTETLSPIQVFPLVLEALKNPHNWKSELPTNTNSLITIKEINEENEEIIIQANSEIIIEQNVAPLDITISKFGNYKPQGVTKFTIKSVSLANTLLPIESVVTEFSPASFKTMNDKDKLSAPSFETLKNGVKVKVNANNSVAAANYIKSKVAEYEIGYRLPPGYDSFKSLGTKDTVKMQIDEFNRFVKGGDIKNSLIGKSYRNKQKSKVQLLKVEYVIVNKKDNTENLKYSFTGKLIEAELFLEEIIRVNPDLKEELKIIPAYMK
jgi:hypothetical protein